MLIALIEKDKESRGDIAAFLKANSHEAEEFSTADDLSAYLKERDGFPFDAVITEPEAGSDAGGVQRGGCHVVVCQGQNRTGARHRADSGQLQCLD